MITGATKSAFMYALYLRELLLINHLFFLHISNLFPGPGSYNLAGMGSDSMRKAYVESTRHGAFGTTSVRIQPIIKKTEAELPGPSHYQVKDQPFQPRYKQMTSNFASLSNRLSEPPTIVKVWW